jgi:ribonuclease T2
MTSGWLILSILLSWSLNVPAFEPFEGTFRATESCPAGVGIQRFQDAVSIEIGHLYPLMGFNRKEGEYVQIRLFGRHPEGRWVQRRCGVIEALASDPAPLKKPKGLLLALSWQPAFCDTHSEKSECNHRSSHRFDASQFALHGLWPEPRGLEYCKTSLTEKELDRAKAWMSLPPVILKESIRERLNTLMPGSLSGLDRHEWVRHGRCYSDDPERFFEAALSYLEAVNGSSLQRRFSDHLGEVIKADSLRLAFEESFGSGAGRALELICIPFRGQWLYSEVRIYLKGASSDPDAFSDSLDREHVPHKGCEQGLVEPMVPGRMSP